MHRILAIIPALNAHSTLNGVLKSLLQSKATLLSHNIILDTLVVDDGSEPRLDSILNPDYYNQIITHIANKGKGAALKTGFQLAIKENYTFVVTMDADGQHAPEILPDLVLFGLRGAYDLVIGKRRINFQSMRFERVISNKITTLIIRWLSRLDIEDSQCGFRLIKTDLLNKVVLHTNNFDTETEFLLKSSKFNIKYANYLIPTIQKTPHSHINHIQDTLRFLRLLLKFI